MNETKKNRGWIKNAAIIFLAVMLVLTFFSNTIMNRSLPEVATVYIQEDSIDSKVRVTGTVSAVENYSVILDQTRTVDSVPVKVGDAVAVGDVLMILEAGDSTELETAKAELHTLELNYQKALINATEADYTQENHAIADAKEALVEAQEKLAACSVSDAEITAAETRLAAAKENRDACQDTLEEAQAVLEDCTPGGGSDDAVEAAEESVTTAKEQMDVAAEKVEEAEDTLASVKLLYGAAYDALIDEAETWIRSDVTAAYCTQYGRTEEELTEDDWAKINTSCSSKIRTSLSSYLSAQAEARLNRNGAEDPYYIAYVKMTDAESVLQDAEDAYSAAQKAYAKAKTAYSDAESDYNEANREDQQYAKAKAAVSAAQKEWNAAEETVTACQEALQALQTKQSEYEAARQEVKSCEKTVEDLLLSLNEQQTADGKTQALENLDLQEMSAQIAEAQEKVDELSADGGTTKVLSKVNGTVQSISVSAGHSATAGEVLAVIEVPDMGYSVTATVTTEQARLLHIGDTASIDSYYWGNSTNLTLETIQPDTKNPQQNKVLTFSVDGDVSAGDTLNFSIGEKNATYDYVVPNSAVRSDTKGKFVLIITAKNSPLGNRYYATRVDVEVLASDDLNSAVTGAFEYGDSVITTTTKNVPVENGDQVRLADANNT